MRRWCGRCPAPSDLGSLGLGSLPLTGRHLVIVTLLFLGSLHVLFLWVQVMLLSKGPFIFAVWRPSWVSHIFIDRGHLLHLLFAG